jgi:hypothetical protein
MSIQFHALSQWHQHCTANKLKSDPLRRNFNPRMPPISHPLPRAECPAVILDFLAYPAAQALLDRQQIHKRSFGASSVETTNNLLFLIKIIVKQCNFVQFRFGSSSVCVKLTDSQKKFTTDSSALDT